MTVTCLLMPVYLFMRIFWDMSAPFIYQPQSRSTETSVASSFTRSTRFQRPTKKSAFTLFLTYFTFPVNRCISSVFSSLIFCGLLIAASIIEEHVDVLDKEGISKNHGILIKGSMYLRLIIMLFSFSSLGKIYG